ncbi:MAG: hypothetical protein ACI4DY_10700, partial [Monoglobaceae bacterium]
MKRLKKQFTLLMVLAMLATSIVLPMNGAVSATDVSAVSEAGSESDSVFIDENFNGYASSEDAVANGWAPGKSGVSFDLEQVDAAHQNSMKLTKTDSKNNVEAKYYAESLTTGKFRYTYSLYLKPTGTDMFLVDTTATESAVTGINLLFVYNGKVYVKDASGANQSLISSPSEGWYTFESVVDLDNKTHEVTAYSADGAQAGYKKLNELGIRTSDGVNDQGVSGIMFRQWETGGTTYVDGVKMMELYTGGPVFINENFNGYVTRGDAMANGWTMGSSGVSFDLEQVDAAHQNSMKLTRSGTNVEAKYYAESLTTGKFRYTYSLYLKPTSTDSFLVDTTATESAVAGINLLFISAGKVYVKDASAANKLLISSLSEGWYTFESVVDLDNTTHEVTAYSADGAQVGHMKLDELGIRTGGVNDQGVSGIMFRQWADTTTYVDDVKMEYYTVDPVLIDENFNDYASSEEAVANGWTLGSNGVSFDLEQVDTAHQNSMKLTKTDKDVQAKYYAASLTTGKFKYTYSLYLKPTSTNMFLVDTTATANAVAGINLLFFSNGSVKVKDASTAD